MIKRFHLNRYYRYRFITATICEWSFLFGTNNFIPKNSSIDQILRFVIDVLIFMFIYKLPIFKGGPFLMWRIECIRMGILWPGRQEDLYLSGREAMLAMSTPSRFTFLLMGTKPEDGELHKVDIGTVLKDKDDDRMYVMVCIAKGICQRRGITLLTERKPPPRKPKRKKIKERLPQIQAPSFPALRPGLVPS